MFRGACIAVLCLAIGGYLGHKMAMNDFNKTVAEEQRKGK